MFGENLNPWNCVSCRGTNNMIPIQCGALNKDLLSTCPWCWKQMQYAPFVAHHILQICQHKTIYCYISRSFNFLQKINNHAFGIQRLYMSPLIINILNKIDHSQINWTAGERNLMKHTLSLTLHKMHLKWSFLVFNCELYLQKINNVWNLEKNTTESE